MGAVYLGGTLAVLGLVNAYIIFRKKALTDFNETCPWYMRGLLLTVVSQIAHCRELPKTLGVWVTLELGGFFICLAGALIHGTCKPPLFPRWLEFPTVPMAVDRGPPHANPAPPQPLPPAPTNLFPEGPLRYIVDLPEFHVQSGPWPIKKADCGNGNPIRVRELVSPHGLGMHPPQAPGAASLKYRLGAKAEVFAATVAINDTTTWCWSPAIFAVIGDGKELWHSEWIAHNHARAQNCFVDVKGVDLLELRVHCVNGNTGAHAVWVEPRLYEKSAAAQRAIELK